MSTATGGTETSKTTTHSGSAVYGEVWSQGNASPASVASIPATPTGRGWVSSSPGAGTFATGNWSATFTLSLAVTGTDFTVRVFRYSAGTYTLIGTFPTKAITTTAKTAYAFTATSFSAITFAAGDLVYVDLWLHDTANVITDNPVVWESNSATAGVASDVQITTSTFTASGTSSVRDIKSRFRLAKFVDIATRFRQRSANQLKDIVSRFVHRMAPDNNLFKAAALLTSPKAYYRLGETSGTTANDSSGNAYNGTISAGVTLNQTGAMPGDPDKAMSFNGTSGFINLPSGLNTAGWTSYSFVWWQNLSSLATFPVPLSNAQADSSNTGFHIWINTTGEVNLVVGIGGANFAIPFGSGGDQVITTGVWQQIAITMTPTVATLYINGVVVRGSPIVGTYAAIASTTNPISIGYVQASLADYVNGTLDEVLIYDKALSANDVVLLYNASRKMPKDITTRFRQMSAPVQKDTSTRFRQRSANVLKDISTRFKLFVFKDTSARLRLMSASQLKDVSSRFRQMSASQFKDITSRFRLASSATSSVRDVATRFRQQSASQLKDVSSRLRLRSADQLKDISTRFRQRSANILKDISTRFKLAFFKDIATRLRLMSATQFKNISARFRSMSQAQQKDVSSRLKLKIPMPVGDIGGWHQIFADDLNTDVALGSFPAAVSSTWGAYPDGWIDSNGDGTYNATLTCSVSNSILNIYVHQAGGVNYCAVPYPQLPAPAVGNAVLYGRFAVCFRSDAVSGYKTAWLLWPASGVWPRDGEIDFPEGSLNSTINAYMHHQGGTVGSDQDAYGSTTTYTDWHVAVIEWLSNRCTFILDGTVIGESTTLIPNTPMYWVLQTETNIGGTAPTASDAGNVQVDWVAVYIPTTVQKDITTRFRLAGTNQQIKDIPARFRQRSANQFKDATSRFRLMSALQLKDTATRLRLRSANQLKDIASRVRLMSVAQLKDIGTRFRIAWYKDIASRLRLRSADQLKDTASRVRLMSALQNKDTASRFRQRSSDQLRDVKSRMRLQSAAQLRDLPARLRVQSAAQLKDIASRLWLVLGINKKDIAARVRLRSADQLKDITSRLVLALASQRNKDIASRLRLQSAAQLKDLKTRLLLSVLRTKDITSRVRLMSALQAKDTASRLRLRSANQLRDVSARLRQMSALQTRDVATRLRQISASQLKDVVSRLRMQSAFQLRDISGRVRLRSANLLRDVASRVLLISQPQRRDVTARYRLSSAWQFKDVKSRFTQRSANQLRDVTLRLVVALAQQRSKDVKTRFRMMAVPQKHDIASRLCLYERTPNADMRIRRGTARMRTRSGRAKVTLPS
jgi:hypothetical protein